MWIKIKEFILDILFPKFCFNCQKEGNYLCEDCQSLLEISGFHRNYPARNLGDLYFAVDYKNPLIKKLIQSFKYEPLVKELGKPLSSLIISHFQLMDNKPNFADFILIPVPLHKKRLKWRGFNQTETLAKELTDFFKVPLVLNCLTKTKETSPQIEFSDQARKENIKGVFGVKNKELIRNKNVLLVDDVYTTGSTMEECAGVLKKAGAKKIIGIVVARG